MPDVISAQKPEAPASSPAHPARWQERIVPILWPLSRRFSDRLESWHAACILLAIPLTAMLHHLLQGHRCMLETYGTDYNFAALKQLFLRDPSLPWAIVAMVVAYHLGKAWPLLRQAAAPAFAALLPLTIWLWDIPFSGRFVCHHLHDGRVHLAGVRLNTTWIYALCLLLYCIFQSMLVYRKTRA